MSLTREEAEARSRDRALTWWKDQPITKLEEHESGWTINLDGSGFALSREALGDADPPRVGDTITLYTHRGSMIRGIDLRGEPLFYKTDAELEAEQEQWVAEKQERDKAKFENNREQMDADFEALPEVFKRRVQWFRDHNPDFRWEFEAYEMSSCMDAVRIAEAMQTAEGVEEYAKAEPARQRELVPDVQYDRHSGNSFGMACRLAALYMVNPLLVIAEHGAMTPLSGCEEYGCAHPREDDVLEAVAAWAEASENPAP